MKRWIWFLVFSLMFVDLAKPAGLIVVWDSDTGAVPPIPPRAIPPPWPGPRPGPPPFIRPPERHFAFAPLEVASVQVTARISDQIAATSFEEEFYNPNSRPIEGTFLFPIPKGAHLDKFSMEIGGKMVEAELLDADKARHLYEEIVRKIKDPALLEYAGRDLLKARLFPIEAHSHKRVSVSYSELLRADSGLVRYALPLGGEKYSASPVKNLSMKIDLETKRPLKSIYSPSHTVEIRRHGANEATVGFEAANTRPEGDFELFFAAEKDEVGFSSMAYRTGTEDGYFLLLAAPGVEMKERRVLAKDVAFVLDTSGSMAGPKLEQAKKALLFCIENLNESDRFQVIRFATETEPLFAKLEESSKENRVRAAAFVKQLKPIGGTAIDEALRQALRLRPSQSDRPYLIVFLTDGRPTVGTTDEEQILAHVSQQNKDGDPGNTRIFCFGIGTDVNTHLLDNITEATRAFSQYVLPEEDIEVKVSSFFSKIKEPVLANLKLRSAGGPRLAQIHPAELPDLFQGEQLVVVGRYSGSGAATLTLEGKADGQTRRFDYQVQFPDSAGENAFIPRLWATRRVGYLLDQIRLHGDNQELRQEATELARQFGIVTPYTAYLILEDEMRRGVPIAVQSLPQLREDRPAQALAQQFYTKVNRERSGEAAVAGARYGLALKQADNVQAMSLGNQEAQRGFAATVPDPALSNSQPISSGRGDSARRLAGYAQQSQFVNGRNFFLNGQEWIDAAVQKQTSAKRVRIPFNSAEYFKLLEQEPSAAAWMALGRNVQFVLGDTVYEVFDSPERRP